MDRTGADSFTTDLGDYAVGSAVEGWFFSALGGVAEADALSVRGQAPQWGYLAEEVAVLRVATVVLICFTFSASVLSAQEAVAAQASRLQAQIVDAFHINFVAVKLGELGPEYVVQVTFEDSTIFSLPKSDRRKAARGVAEFIRDHFAGYNKLTMVLVSWSARSPDGATEGFFVPFRVSDLAPTNLPPKSQ